MIETRTDETKGADGAPVFLTLRGFVAKHQAFTAGGLRHLLFQDPEGFREACVVRFGRRVLIDEGRFFEWLKSNRSRTNLFGTPTPKVAEKPKAGAKAKGARGAR
jgi:hypothetical protein